MSFHFFSLLSRFFLVDARRFVILSAAVGVVKRPKRERERERERQERERRERERKREEREKERERKEKSF